MKYTLFSVILIYIINAAYSVKGHRKEDISIAYK